MAEIFITSGGNFFCKLITDSGSFSLSLNEVTSSRVFTLEMEIRAPCSSQSRGNLAVTSPLLSSFAHIGLSLIQIRKPALFLDSIFTYRQKYLSVCCSRRYETTPSLPVGPASRLSATNAPGLPQVTCAWTNAGVAKQKSNARNIFMNLPLPVIGTFFHVWVGSFHPTFGAVQFDETELFVESVCIFGCQDPTAKSL